MLVVFASEVSSLMDLDKFHPRSETLKSITSRISDLAKLFQHIQIVDEDDDVKIQTVETKPEFFMHKLFARQLANHVTIKGRILLQNKVICMEKRRTKKFNHGPFPNELCLAQVYLWLLNEKGAYVRFTELHGDQSHVTIIEEDSLFTLRWTSSIASLLKDRNCNKPSVSCKELPLFDPMPSDPPPVHGSDPNDS